MQNETVKGFYVNLYNADGTPRWSGYERTEAKANARAERMRKTFAKKHPDRIIEVSKQRAYKA